MNKQDSAEILLRETISQYNLSGYEQDALQFSTSLMYIYIDQHSRLSELKQLIDQYDQNSKQFDEHHNLPPSQRIFYYYKVRYYEEINRLDSAEYYYRKIYRPNMSYTAKNPLYKGLLSVFKKHHQPDSIAKYAQLYCEVNDSSIAIKDQQLTAQLAASYNYNRYQKEAKANEQKASRIRTILIGLVSVFLIIAIICIWQWDLYRQSQKTRMLQLKQEQQRKQLELEQLQAAYTNATESYEENLHELRLLEESRKKVISIIQGEINGLSQENEAYKTKLAESQRTIAKINVEYERGRMLLTEENQELKSRIDELKSKDGISEHLVESGLFAETEIVKQVKAMSVEPQRQMTQDQWESLYKAFCEHFPALSRDLISLNINSHALRVCMLDRVYFFPS